MSSSNSNKTISSLVVEVILVSFIVLGVSLAVYLCYKKQNQEPLVLDQRSDVPVLVLNNIEELKKDPKSHKVKKPDSIVVGEFRTNYFFEENLNLLKDHDLDPQFHQLKNGHRQIYLKLSVNESLTNSKKRLDQLKLLKLIPADAFIKFK